MDNFFDTIQSHFTTHPHKVLGEVVMKKRGDRGDDVYEEIVKGSSKNIEEGIEVPLVKKWTPTKSTTKEVKKEVAKTQAKPKTSNRRKALVNNRKNARIVSSQTTDTSYNVDTLKESYEKYNHRITQDDLDAWLLTHPSDILHQVFTPKKTIEELIGSGHIFKKVVDSKEILVYRYRYLYGNIADKIKDLHRNVNMYVDVIGETQYNFQLSELEKALPTRKRVQAENENERLYIPPHSNFAKKFFIKELRKEASPQVYGIREPISLYEYFIHWLSRSSLSIFVISNKQDVIKYVKNKRFRLSDSQKENLTGEEKERLKDSFKENAKEEANRLFREFLATQITRTDQQLINEQWNVQYNGLVDTYRDSKGKIREIYEKIPVAFGFSKVFKEGFPLQLSETQRNGVAFSKLKGSALLGYDVGVGKTLTNIACVSEAFESERANICIQAVPDATLEKWSMEMIGGLDKKTKRWIHGAIPHINVLNWKNLNWKFVYENVREYSASEKKSIDLIINLIQEYRSTLKGERTLKEKKITIKALNVKLKKVRLPDIVEYQFDFLVDIITAIQEYVDAQGEDRGTKALFVLQKLSRLLTSNEMSKNFTTADYDKSQDRVLEDQENRAIEKKVEEYRDLLVEGGVSGLAKVLSRLGELILATLSQERDMLVYTLGSFKEIPSKTIILVNHTGLTRLGFSHEVGEKLRTRFFQILSQGEESFSVKNSALAEQAKREASILKTIDKSMGFANREARLFVDELDVDMLCIDEAHNMKKVFTNVIGEKKPEDQVEEGKSDRDDSRFKLNSGQPSLAGIHAFCMSQYIQLKTGGQNVILLSATPFTNSPLEIFSMLSLVNYNFLERNNYANIHEFFNTFIKERQELLVQPDGSVKVQPTVVGFHNLMELKKLIYHLIHYKTGEDAGVVRPLAIHLPDNTNQKRWKGVKTFLVMNDLQKTYMKKVLDYIRFDRTIEEVCDLSGTDLMCSLPRTYVKKLNKSLDSLRRNDIDFADEAEATRLLRGLAFQKAIAISPYLFGCNDLLCPTATDFVENSPKIKYTIECIKTVKDWHDQHEEEMSGQVIYMDAGVEYHGLIKEYIVENLGFKEDEVGLVNGQVSASRKEKIKTGFLNGDVKIIIGSSTIKEGIDLQKRSSVLYNLTPDWNPTDYNQLSGRIWRQGNQFAYVRIVNVLMSDTSDVFVYQKLQEKTQRLKELLDRDGKISQLDLEDVNHEEIKEALITNPRVKAELRYKRQERVFKDELILISAQVKKLVQMQTAHEAFKGTFPSIAGVVNRFNIHYSDYLREEDKKEIELKVQEYKKKGKEYKRVFNPDDERYNVVEYDPNSTSKAEIDHLNTRLRTVMVKIRELSEDEKIWSFAVVSEIYGNLQSSYNFQGAVERMRQVRADFLEGLEVLESMGKTTKEVEELIEQKNKKINELNEKVSQSEREKIIESLTQQIESEQKNALALQRSLEERVEEFASLNSYLEHKVQLPKLEPITQEPNQEDVKSKRKEYLRDIAKEVIVYNKAKTKVSKRKTLTKIAKIVVMYNKLKATA